MSTRRQGPPAGAALLANHDRWADARTLDVESLCLRKVGRGPTEREHVHGWFVLRQRRVHALFRWDDRLRYLCGRRLWDVEEAVVWRRALGPTRSLTFASDSGTIGACRWLDSELAHRWFLPKWLDIARDEDDAEDFDWSRFIEAVLSTDRRHRIGLPPGDAADTARPPDSQGFLSPRRGDCKAPPLG